MTSCCNGMEFLYNKWVFTGRKCWHEEVTEELDVMTEVVLQDTGRYPCRQCSRVSGHKLDCTEDM